MRDVERDREDLIARVGAGELTPEQAEAEANAYGFGPLEGCRDPERFDPLQERRWTMPMTVAWIRWRKVERVREQMVAYRKAARVWREWRGKWGLVHDEPPSTSMLKLDQDGEDYGRIVDAQDELWGRLQDEALVATGIDLKQTKRPVPIPAVEWSYLTLWGENSRPNSVSAKPNKRFHGLDRGLENLRYDDIRVSRDDVQRLWPAPEPATRQATRHENALRAFLTARHPAYLDLRNPRPHGTNARLAAEYADWAGRPDNYHWPRTMTSQAIGQKFAAWAKNVEKKK